MEDDKNDETYPPPLSGGFTRNLLVRRLLGKEKDKETTMKQEANMEFATVTWMYVRPRNGTNMAAVLCCIIGLFTIQASCPARRTTRKGKIVKIGKNLFSKRNRKNNL